MAKIREYLNKGSIFEELYQNPSLEFNSEPSLPLPQEEFCSMKNYEKTMDKGSCNHLSNNQLEKSSSKKNLGNVLFHNSNGLRTNAKTKD